MYIYEKENDLSFVSLQYINSINDWIEGMVYHGIKQNLSKK